MTEQKTQQKPALDVIVAAFNKKLESYGYGWIVELSVLASFHQDSVVTYRDALARQLPLR